MKSSLNKWICSLLIVALILPGTPLLASSINEQPNHVWTLENDVIRAVVDFTEEEGIRMRSFFNKRANREYLPANDHISSLFSYTYRYLEEGETGKESVGETITLNANDSGYEIGNATIEDIRMTSEKNVVSTIGQRLEIPISKQDVTVTLAFDIYEGHAGIKYQAYIRNDNEDQRLQITSSDVLQLNVPDEPRNTHYSCITKWYSTTGAVNEDNCAKASEDIKLIINLYDSGDGFYIGPETNSKTQTYRREPGTTDNTPYMGRAFAGIDAFGDTQGVKVSTNSDGMQLVLFPEEQFEYIAVNMTAFTGDIVDAKMAVEEHLRTRFKYNHTSTILNTNDWQWGQSNRSETYYRSTAVPIAKRAGFEMVMFDDDWNNADNFGLSRDGVHVLPHITDDMIGLADYYKSEGLLFGLWYSLSGGYHNRGNDLADPEVIEAKQEKIQWMIDNYHVAHHMIDLTQFWLNDAVTDYSHPTDNVYRKNVLSKDMMNAIVELNPEYKVKYTTEVDIWPSQGDRSNELLHVIHNGWTTSSTEFGENLDIQLFAGNFGHLPLNSVYFNNGDMRNATMSNLYKYMFSRNVKHGDAPHNWSENSIQLSGQFNEWRRSERIVELTDGMMRPLFAGVGWDDNVVGSWNPNTGPYVMMHVTDDKDRALMIATGGGKPGPSNVEVNLRWLDPNKQYLIEDITIDDTGIVTYGFKGLLSGDELKSFAIDLDENTTKGKAFWVEEFKGDSYQVLYADEKVRNAAVVIDGSGLLLEATGNPNETGIVILYGRDENATMNAKVSFDADGAGSLSIDEFESTDDLFVPSLPSSATYLAFQLNNAQKVTTSGGSAGNVAGGTTPGTSQYGVNFTSSSTTPGSYMDFAIDVAKPAVYRVQAAAKLNSGRATGQWYIDGEAAGDVWNQRAASEHIGTHDLGIVTFATPGEKIFRFVYEGPDAGHNSRVINTDRIMLTPVLTESGSTDPSDAEIVISGNTTVELGEDTVLSARVEGLAPLYTTADYVRWVVESQEPVDGSSRAVAIVPNGLDVRVVGIKPGKATIKAMSTVSGAVSGVVEVNITGEIVVPPSIDNVTVGGSRVLGTALTAQFDIIRGSNEANAEDFIYVWNRSGQPIDGAVGQSYITTAADMNNELRVHITPVDVMGNRGQSQESLPVFVIEENEEPMPTPTPSSNPTPSPTSGPIPTPLPTPTASAIPDPSPTPSPTPDIDEETIFPGFKEHEVLISAGGIGLNKKNDAAFVSGYPDNSFKPDHAITREEALTMLYNLVVNNDKHDMDIATNPYSDVRQNAYSIKAILYFSNKGIVSGTGSGQFAPNKAMTRAEFARLLSSFLPDQSTDLTLVFNDLNGHWAEADINRLAAAGLMIGFGDGTFRPDAELTRAQIVAVLGRLLGRIEATSGIRAFTDVPSSHWAYGYIMNAAQ